MDDPKAWRSTMDKSSGYTYYYHRKTRVSQWVKPDCIIREEERLKREAELAEQQLLAIAQDEELGRGSGIEYRQEGEEEQEAHYDQLMPDDDEPDANAVEYRQDQDEGYPISKQERNGEQEEDDEYAEYRYTEDEEPTKQAQSHVSQVQVVDGVDGAGIASDSMIADLLTQIQSSSHEQTLDALMVLLSCCIPATSDAIAAEPHVLSVLTGAIMSTSTGNSNSSNGELNVNRSIRHTALKIIWCLCSGKRAAAQSFCSDVSWLDLADRAEVWGSKTMEDFESVVIYGATVGMLLGNKNARKVIPEELSERLAYLINMLTEQGASLDLEYVNILIEG